MTFMPTIAGDDGHEPAIAEYDPKFESLNFLCTMGSYLLAVSTFPFIINAIWSWMWSQGG